MCNFYYIACGTTIVVYIIGNNSIRHIRNISNKKIFAKCFHSQLFALAATLSLRILYVNDYDQDVDLSK